MLNKDAGWYIIQTLAYKMAKKTEKGKLNTLLRKIHHLIFIRKDLGGESQPLPDALNLTV